MPDFSDVPRSVLPLALEGALRRIVSNRKVCPHFSRIVRPCLGADAVWVYRGDRRPGHAEEWCIDGDEGLRDERRSVAFFEKDRPKLPRSVLLSPLRVDGHLVGVVGAARRDGGFKFGEGHVLNRLAYVLGEDLSRREDERLTRVLNRIREEVLAELRPRDLAYQILDSLYQLVQYDHSAALLLHDASTNVLRVEAEKIVWMKAKSAFVGHEMRVDHDLLGALAPGPGVVTQVVDPAATPGADQDDRVWDLLYYNRGEGIPVPTALICAPLFLEGEVLGLLKIVAHGRSRFSERDLTVVRRFLPAAAVSLRNVRERLSLEDHALRAESRASLVTLARAVAHDVNNAIGALLPLAEQAREDARDGQLDHDSLEGDLDVIIDKAVLCKRIFSNMLRVGIEQSGGGPVNVNQLIVGMRDLLVAHTGARSIRLELDLADDLPVSRFSKPHLEHILWNLVANAVDAMTGRGGRIRISTRRVDAGSAVLTVADDGLGIAPEHLEKVQEPFFSTKSDGNGLGLSICRSMAWQYGGGLEIESELGRGTEVRVRLPHMTPDPPAASRTPVQ